LDSEAPFVRRADDEEAEGRREEYGFPDRGEASSSRTGVGTFAGAEAAKAAEEALAELKAPRDPAP
jgi:hypothetical protein